MINTTKLLQQKEYLFLHNNPDLKNVIYLTLSGSYAYGTNNEASDIDLRGILIEDKRYLFGLNSFEQFEDEQTDTVIYSLKKFVGLCANANPNALELLGTDENCLVKITKAGQILRNNASLFLTRRAADSFGNYASAQLRRLANALCHDYYDPEQQKKHLSDILNAQIGHFSSTYTSFDKNSIKLYTQKEQLLCDLNLQAYPLKDFAGIYSEMQNIIRTYGKLNHRNKKKDDKHLYKHAMHLIRLLIMGKDILGNKGIITKRISEHQLLMDLRNGKYTFAEIFAMADRYQEEFAKATQVSVLPDQPDMEKIEQLLVELYQTF